GRSPGGDTVVCAGAPEFAHDPVADPVDAEARAGQPGTLLGADERRVRRDGDGDELLLPVGSGVARLLHRSRGLLLVAPGRRIVVVEVALQAVPGALGDLLARVRLAIGVGVGVDVAVDPDDGGGMAAVREGVDQLGAVRDDVDVLGGRLGTSAGATVGAGPAVVLGEDLAVGEGGVAGML